LDIPTTVAQHELSHYVKLYTRGVISSAAHFLCLQFFLLYWLRSSRAALFKLFYVTAH